MKTVSRRRLLCAACALPLTSLVACGKDDFLIQANKDFSELLRKKGVRHEFVISEGNHSWPVWRRYLLQFAPVLFQDAPPPPGS